MERFELRNKIQKKYELENGQKITIKRLLEISENEKIDLKDLILILGCYKNAKYKSRMHLFASAFFGFLVLYSRVWVIISYGIAFYEIIY